MKTFEEIKIMSLRPAFYNGTQFEAEVSFDEASAFRVSITETEAVNMILGDTVRISGKIKTEDEKDYEYISVFMCGDELSEFIEKYGVHKVSGTVRMKLELIHAVYYEDATWDNERKKEDLTVYKLLGIGSADGKD